jgi:hypothetical protein
MKRIHLPLLFLSLGLLTACTGSQDTRASVWIEVPLQGLEFPLGAEIHIEGHAVNTGAVYGMELWANEEMLDTIDVMDQGSLLHFEHFWTPEQVGDYLLTVVSLTEDEVGSGEDTVTIHITSEDPTTTSEPAVTEEVAQPEPTVTEEVPDTEVCTPSVTASMNANCRFGPDAVFDVLGYLLQDETALRDGRLADNSWWFIQNPDRAGQCWIASNVVQADCVSDEIPIVAAPPTPTPEPVDLTPPPVPSPAYPTGGQAIACMSQVFLAWNPVSDESGIAGHQVQMEQGPSYSPVPGSPWNTGDGNKHQVDIECGGYYRWRVRAQDGEGNWSDFSSWTYFEVILP